MKLVRERDIPALQGKTWWEKAVLRRKAQKLDPRIFRRTAVLSYGSGFIGMPVMVALVHFRRHGDLPSLLWPLLIFAVLVSLAGALVYTLWVTPLVKNALEAGMPVQRPDCNS